MAKIHKQHTFEVYSSRPQSDDITHAHPTTHQLGDKLYNEHSMPVSRVTVQGVNGGHKLVHNASAQRRELIFRVLFVHQLAHVLGRCSELGRSSSKLGLWMSAAEPESLRATSEVVSTTTPPDCSIKQSIHFREDSNSKQQMLQR